MKKRILFCLVVIVVLFFALVISSSCVYARGYIGIGGGGGGQAKGSNGRVEFGGYSTAKSVNLMYGLGIPFTLNRDDLPNGTLEYPCPHNDYRGLGIKDKGAELGVYAKFGVEPIKDTGVFIFAIGGATWGSEVDLVQSNATGWYYEQSKRTTTYGLYGGGLGFFPKESRFCIQASYDNRMGVNGLIGFVW